MTAPARANTIYALSSGLPPAAIAIVRVSGPEAAMALERLAGRVPPPRRAMFSSLHDPQSSEKLDDALALFFPGPGSATGEDLAEFHLHGGRSVVAAVLDALSGLDGLRPAEAGEFTRRAFENGRIDLTEAEGIADLLMAETQSQRRAALALAGGALSREVAGWQDRLLAIAARVEAEIDFSDEDDVETSADEAWRAVLLALAGDIRAALSRPPVERLKDGIRVVIAGPPNAGKSTLINALAGRDVAITSPIAGTTRDVVEAPVAVSGLPFILTDTAGLRASGDIVEGMGIERAQAQIAAADLILWLGPFDARPDPDRTIVIAGKIDVTSADPRADVALSAVTGEGMDRLLGLLRERAMRLLPGEGEVAINARHRAALEEALNRLNEAAGSSDLLIVAEGLRQARSAFDAITGRAGVENMLDALFGRFCIGK
ncbi:MAG TPA: tRNA uridine-5-carboxymethylaminomethyl(34) synthesis GTPase MnmE [Allosphingosinicella sp.]